MIKRMLIDDTQPEETRVVVVNGNKLEDVEFETSYRRQIKGNIYLGKVMRVEPSLQACFVDYGGNKHGFMAFGEIHPDYYDLPPEEITEVEKEVDEIIESKKQAIKEREAERERIRQERAAARAAREAALAEEQAAQAVEQPQPEMNAAETAVSETDTLQEEADNQAPKQQSEAEFIAEAEEGSDKKHAPKKRVLKKRYRKQHAAEETPAKQESANATADAAAEGEKESPAEEPLKVLTENTGTEEETISEEVDAKPESIGDEEIDADDDETELDFELQRKLIRARKLYHRNKIQDVIKEGQIVLVQVVKEERGNKGAALTTYLSLAGRYCVLMPNRIKSGGVSRKITNAADRTRLKGIVKELPLTPDMSIIVRTAGEEKTKADIVRDYNYLIRTWNQIRTASLQGKAPSLIHEEGNLIKRALRDIYTKEVSEIIVAGEEGYRAAKEFFKILSPRSLKKIKSYRNNDMPLFQRFQVESQLDKLHDTNAQLESGGYLVINPTEALVSIDVNSGRATKEKDLEETALKTNLEACDEIARQLRLRNLAGLVVIDFIDMDEPANNHAVEKRMKEALKKDRSRIQVGKMSMFGLLELSRQRMHSSFFESNYQVCPYCQGKGMIRTVENGAFLVLRGIEEEGIKNRSSRLNIFVPSDIAVFLLNHKRQMLVTLEHKYKMEIIISADDSIKCISDFRIERIKITKPAEDEKAPGEDNIPEPKAEETEIPANDDFAGEEAGRENRRGRDNRRRGRNRFDRRRPKRDNGADNGEPRKAKQEAVILYNSHEDITSKPEPSKEEPKEKETWWKKLIKG